ncbi:MAG: NFACT family protein [Erysipelotrichaceae bacterium]|nr:NFACT family protein [Erysipelotrichaceae bacterium]
MAFDGIFLRQILRQLDVIIDARVNKIYQISDTEILFILHNQQKYQLMISCHSSFNRIHLTSHQYPTRDLPSSFIMLLRKYLEGGTITSIRQADLDRYLVIEISSRNQLGDKVTYQLYVELMGKYANLIMVYDGKIMDSLKRIPPFENNKRTIQPGALFKPTENQQGKSNPFELEDVSEDENLFEKLTGFSPLLSDEFIYRMKNGEKYSDILKEISASDKVYISEVNGQQLFHCIRLKHLNVEPEVMDICAGLDYLYFSKEERERIRHQTGDLFKFIRREIKKCENKIDRLNLSLQESLDCDRWRNYGDILYAHPDANTKGLSSITLTDFEDNPVEIPVDGKLDLKANAKKCFQKYHKGSTGQKYIREQIQLTEDNLTYFQQLQSQLEMADFDSAAEIRTELENNGYLRKKTTGRRNSKKKNIPNFLTIQFEGQSIFVGKNNIQNEYVTFEKAHRNHTWFHVRDGHGSHVVIDTETPDEQQIRFCAMLAAWFSPARMSSSIPVNYTLVKNLKKIPGSKTGKVIMKEYQTIFIDTDEQMIRRYVG